MKVNRILLLALFVCMMIFAVPGMAMASGTEHQDLGDVLPIWSCIPFVGMLLSIALFPLIKPHWWEHHLLKVALFWSALFLIPFGFVYSFQHMAYHVLEIVFLDYLTFIILLWSLFTVAGGISLQGTLIGTTKINVLLIGIGTLLASWIGTTGASMVMIRPLLKANAWRKRKAHVVVFFIFLVSNIGGCLTPVGDPPLFLGFLRHVPFFWTMHLLPIYLVNSVVLLTLFFIIDRVMTKKDMAEGFCPPNPNDPNFVKEPIKIRGLHNVIFLAMIVGAVILCGAMAKMPELLNPVTGAVKGITIVFDGIVLPWNYITQMAIQVLAAFLSLKTTKKAIREANAFTWGPITEVAQLFIGIFLTMIPALAILRSSGSELGLTEPWQFFWMTGALSSFLDNAPTYLVFMTTAGALGSIGGLPTSVGVIPPTILMAISAGAVFMGANTYIGNAPNFMVKSIAEENGVKMPSFFGYMSWSIRILIPVFLLDTILFFI